MEQLLSQKIIKVLILINFLSDLQKCYDVSLALTNILRICLIPLILAIRVSTNDGKKAITKNVIRGIKILPLLPPNF